MSVSDKTDSAVEREGRMSALLEKIAVTLSTRRGSIYSIPQTHFRADFRARAAFYDARSS
jgi:hypothetical protein